LIAVIVENRNIDVDVIIERHMKYLLGWDVEHLKADIKNAHDYNNLLTSEKFWSRYLDHERVLIFQHDSGMLRDGVEELLEWDYVGAPWKLDAPWNTPDKSGGNGGFSLRNPKKSLNLIKEKPYHPRYGNEDVYYSHFLPLVGGKVAPREVCQRFACETEFYLNTLGYHAIEKHLPPDQVDKILNQNGCK
jgi:hypothetical protein